jgi:coenzyme F420-0:L-glutamate ligase/coenzyme F420-1:gamma-L-glutamate ligase
MVLTFTPIQQIPMIDPGDDLAKLVTDAFGKNNIQLRDDDILVFTQKIVSKSENRLRNLTQIEPTPRAIDLAALVRKDPRLVELILQESKSVLRASPGVLIVEHRIGVISANAGIDHSNVKGPWGNHEDWVLLLPTDPDASAQNLREELCKLNEVKRLGVLIIDSHGRPWRIGTIGTSIGIAGMPGVVDLRGEKDIFGYKMQYTIINTADELAAGASLVMGQLDERVPVVHVRGFPYPLKEGHLPDVLRSEKEDLFR